MANDDKTTGRPESTFSRRDVLHTGIGVSVGLLVGSDVRPAVVVDESGEDERISGRTLRKLVQDMQKGALSSAELTGYYLERIGRYDGPEGLNSFITVDRDGAMRRAEQLDRLIRARKTSGPLHGLPIAVKDNIDTSRMPTTGGTEFLRHWTPPQDAAVVRRLEAAGAIVIGKTNMDELAAHVSTRNPHYGFVRNPYGYEFVPGGSSGGSGAAAAADLCAAAIGTDTGGSVRIPCAHCGLVGIKPTPGRVCRDGLMFLSLTADVIGPMARTVEDAALLLGVMADESTAGAQEYVRGLDHDSIRSASVGVPHRYFMEDLHPDVEAMMKDSIEALRGLGAEIREVDLHETHRYFSTIFTVFTPESVLMLKQYLRSYDPNFTIQMAISQMGPIARAVYEEPSENPPIAEGYVAAFHLDRSRIMSDLALAMEDVDFLLTPTTPAPPNRIDEPTKDEVLRFIRNTAPFNYTTLPTLTVPGGYSRSGIPLGLQFVGRPGSEAGLLRYAHGFEQATRIRKPPALRSAA